MGLSFGCSALHGKDNAISDAERGDGAFVPFIFPWFQYLLTNRNNLLTIRNTAPDELEHACREARDFASQIRVSYDIFLSIMEAAKPVFSVCIHDDGGCAY